MTVMFVIVPWLMSTDRDVVTGFSDLLTFLAFRNNKIDTRVGCFTTYGRDSPLEPSPKLSYRLRGTQLTMVGVAKQAQPCLSDGP